MMLKRKLGLVLMVVFTVNVVFTMTVYGAETQTRHIQTTGDDGFVTEAGILIDSSQVTILDPNMDIRSYLVFRMIEINTWESLNNATLRLRVGNRRLADPGSKATLYGVADGNFNGFASAAQVVSAPLTAQKVNLDTSSFYGNKWVDIDVSDIVAEIKSDPTWEGDDGFTGTIGFIIFGAEGHDGRFFYDKLADNGLEAQLIIVWGDPLDEPPPGEMPPAVNGTEFEWEFNETVPGYFENGTDPWAGEVFIYKVTELGDRNILVVDSDTLNYFNTSRGDPNYVNWAGQTFENQFGGGVEFITSLNGWTFLVGRNGTQLFIYYSDDEFTTWRSDRVNSHFPLSTTSDFGSIWTDQNGSALIHLVWSTYSAWSPADYDIVYSNFTLDPVTENLIWSAGFFNVTESYGDDQVEPDMYQEKDGTIHVVWIGINGTANQIAQYRRRQANGTWLDAVRLSGDAPFNSLGPDVVANEITGVALATWSRVNVGNWDVRWDVVFPNNTVGTVWGEADRILTNARYVSMVNDRENNTVHMVYQDYSGDHVEYRYKEINNVTGWSGSQRVSSVIGRHKQPSISLDEENGTLAVIWWGQDVGDTLHNVFQIGSAPSGTDTLLLNHPLRYPSNADYFSRLELSVSWWLTFPNGTVIDGPFDTYEDAVDAIEDIFDINPKTPAPPSQGWPEFGVLTRFKTRFYILIIGIGLLFGPLFVFAFSRPSGYEFTIGMFVMLIGFALMYAAGQV